MALKISNMRCEHLDEPLGVGSEFPRFSWEIESDGRNIRQEQYQIQVCTSKDFDKTCWDSGIVASSQQHEVLYGGEPLKIQTTYYWRVQAWTSGSSGSGWSNPARFETGFFSLRDWNAGWLAYIWCHIAPGKQSACFARNEFKVKNVSSLVRARAYVASTAGAHGNDTLRMNLYELRINGEKVGDDIYNPGQLSEAKGRALYRAYDIGPMLNEGGNAVGLIFVSARISVEIMLEFDNGRVEYIFSGPGWKHQLRGPYLRLWRHDVYEYGGKGEYYDGGKEFTGWDLPDFDDSAWKTINNFSSPPGILAPQMQSVKVHGTLKPERIVKLPDGRYTVDFGSRLNGHVSIDAKGPEGTKISLRFAEELNPDSTINASSTCSAQKDLSIHEDIYVKRSNEVENFTPNFANHGFRYVEVNGWNGELDPENIRANMVHSTVLNGGGFSCSDERVMQLHQLCERTYLSNLMSVPTDCPSRERQGWPGDAQLGANALCTLFDMRLFYEKWFNDMADTQFSDGCLPYLTPLPKVLIGSDIPWSHGFVHIAWECYMAYGDKSFLVRYYDNFKRWADFLISAQGNDGLTSGHCNYGDHLALEHPTRKFIENAYACRSLFMVARIASVLENQADAELYKTRTEILRDALNFEFMREGCCDNGTQSAMAIALNFDLVPAQYQNNFIERMCSQLENELYFRTGIMGTYAIMDFLSETGRNELAWSLAMSDKPRTWRHWITEYNATAAHERWVPKDESSHQGDSRNHPALIGGIASWLYRNLAGVKPLKPGYEQVRIKPFIPEDIESVSIRIGSPFGFIGSQWLNHGSCLELNVELPPGTSAEIHIPCADNAVIYERNNPASEADGVEFVRGDSNHTVLQTGSGTYSFDVKRS